MKTAFTNITKSTSICSFTASKWNDNAVFDSKVQKRL